MDRMASSLPGPLQERGSDEIKKLMSQLEGKSALSALKLLREHIADLLEKLDVQTADMETADCKKNGVGKGV